MTDFACLGEAGLIAEMEESADAVLAGIEAVKLDEAETIGRSVRSSFDGCL